MHFSRAKLDIPDITVVGVHGGANPPDQRSGMDAQVETDLEVAGSVAPKAKYRIYFAPSNNEPAFVAAVDRAVADHVSVTNICWGLPESAWTPRMLNLMNGALRRVAAVGITVMAATGDHGVTDGVKDGARHVDFPPSSPYFLAVGGTFLRMVGGHSAMETAWSGSGGGESRFIGRPSWQADLSVSPRNPGRAGRLIPDISAYAHPTRGCKVVVDGNVARIGGTTIAAPLVTGLVADLNQQEGRNLGYITPTIYRELGRAGVLTPVTSGDNSADGVTGYKARPGWNAVTGWGVLDLKKLTRQLANTRK